MSVAALIAPVAARQHGLAHLQQLREQGVSEQALRSAVRTGEIERILPEVYRVAGAPHTWKQDVMAAVLDAWPDGVASHRTAACLLCIAHRDAPQLVEITVPRSRYSRSPGVIVHRSLDLSPDHVMTVDGIPCTGPLRTLVDLGAVEPFGAVVDALERALQSGHATLLGAEWMLTKLRRRGRNGCGVFSDVLDRRALLVASPQKGLLEPRMARVLAGLPPYEYQYKVFNDNGIFVAQVDFACPAIKEGFEVDGFETHGTPDAMTHDFDRDHDLRAAGWGVTHFTWNHVVRRPKYVREVYLGVLRAHGVVQQR
jgi:predicted transcriptional regulator of viral defense system